MAKVGYGPASNDVDLQVEGPLLFEDGFMSWGTAAGAQQD